MVTEEIQKERIAGYEITRLTNTVIISTGTENGYPGCLMVTKIRDGQLAYQSVISKKDLAKTITTMRGFQWVSRLSLARLNAYGPLFSRNPTTRKLTPLF